MIAARRLPVPESLVFATVIVDMELSRKDLLAHVDAITGTQYKYRRVPAAHLTRS
jgi:hypothetical protein